ncbi:MAG: Gfo/Idh/MocA family oxidoreductase [Isosphaeraceae bacterium]
MNTAGTTPVVRWGILGTGVVARAFAEDLCLVPGAVLSAVASRQTERAHAFANQFRARRAHDTVEALAGDDDVDIVYVASPHDRHREHCLACLSAGRALLCEKPFARTAAEAREVIDQARRSRRFCMEAMWMRFHPLLLKVRSMVRSGDLGQIRLLTADFGYPTPFDPDNRFFDPRQGGGALLDRGVYLISLAHFLLGTPAEIVGRASIGPTGVDEQESLLCSHDGGALAVLTSSLRSRLRNEAVIIGTHGQIRIHEPFYAPRRVSWTRSVEPTGTPGRVMPTGGWKTRIKRSRLFRRAFETIGRPVLESMRRNTRSIAHHAAGHGYEFEAAEAMRCLGEGLMESPLMPLDDTLAILDSTDRLRRSWGLAFPDESLGQQGAKPPTEPSPASQLGHVHGGQ